MIKSIKFTTNVLMIKHSRNASSVNIQAEEFAFHWMLSTVAHCPRKKNLSDLKQGHRDISKLTSQDSGLVSFGLNV